MLPDFINKNERFLRLCCNAARFFGSLLIAFVALSLISIPLLGKHFSQFIQFAPRAILHLVFPAFLLLGMAQLIKCLIVSDFKPNWILRFGDKIIYIYVSFLFINFVYGFMYTHKMIYSIVFVLNILMPSAISIFIKILIWIGIGLSLKRIMPIIQESKTLV